MKNDTFDIHVTNYGLVKAGFLFTLGAIAAKLTWATFGAKMALRSAKKLASKGATEIVDKAFIAFEDALSRKSFLISTQSPPLVFSIIPPPPTEVHKKAGADKCLLPLMFK